jgi:hypothetical protein
MAAPNLIGATTIYGRTAGNNISTTSATMVLNNLANSGKCLKINTLNVANYSSSAANITINFYPSTSNVTGTALPIVSGSAVPAFSTLNVIDKTSQYYLEENESIGAIAGFANVFAVTVSFEEIA